MTTDKGIAITLPVIALILLILSSLGVGVHFAFNEYVNKESTAIEQQVVSAINEVENAKRLSENILAFGSYQALYDLGKNGGFTETEKPYWIKIDTQLYPDEAVLENNFNLLAERRANDMINTQPSYDGWLTKIKLNYFSSSSDWDETGVRVYGKVSSPIEGSNTVAEVKGRLSAEKNIETKFLRMYRLGRSVLGEVEDSVKGKTTEDDINSALASLENTKNSEYNAENIGWHFELKSLDSGYAEVFVKITDKNKKLPVFDRSTNENVYDFVSLEFYLLLAT